MKKFSFWYRMAVSIVTIGLSIVLAGYVFTQVEQVMFDWWTYPLFAVYAATVLAIDFLIDRQELRKPEKVVLPDAPHNEKSARPDLSPAYLPQPVQERNAQENRL